MAETVGEIEKYQLEQFNNGLKSCKILRSELHVASQLIEKILSSSSPSGLASLRENLYSLKDILSECQALSAKHPLIAPRDLISRETIKRRLKVINEQLRKISKGKADSSLNGALTRSLLHGSESLRWSPGLVDPNKVHGFNNRVTQLEELLQKGFKDDEKLFKAIGITGTNGVGKTTLCQFLLTRPKVKSMFVPRIGVSMSRNGNEGDDVIVRRLLDALGVDEDMVKSIAEKHHGLAGLLSALHTQLMGKRYLIVLDDARDADEWYQKLSCSLPKDGKWEDRLAYGFPKGYGGAVIVTSRREEVTKMMLGGEILQFPLLPIEDPESIWSIFKDQFHDPKKLASGVEDLKSQIIQKCCGLPLQAKMMGQVLNEKGLESLKVLLGSNGFIQSC